LALVFYSFKELRTNFEAIESNLGTQSLRIYVNFLKNV